MLHFSVPLLGLVAGLVTARPSQSHNQSSGRQSGLSGALYFQTNGFGGNQIVASAIGTDGLLRPSTAYDTNGKGLAGNNTGEGAGPHPDPFYGSGSVVVSKNMLFTVNAGSDSMSAFKISKRDPTKLKLVQTVPSVFEFPASIAVTPDGRMACVMSIGAENGIACYTVRPNGSLQHLPQNDRRFGIQSFTPPQGPAANGNPSQLAFTADGKKLVVAVKGFLPTDENNPSKQMQQGHLSTFMVEKYRLSEKDVRTEIPSPAGFPFSISQDLKNPNGFFSTDVLVGAAVSTMNSDGTFQISAAAITPQAATCWAKQSSKTGNYYTVDTGGPDRLSNITEVSVNWKDMSIKQRATVNLGVAAFGTDNAVGVLQDGNEYLWTMAAGFQGVYTHRIDGPGQVALVQFLNFSNPDIAAQINLKEPNSGYTGQAVFLL